MPDRVDDPSITDDEALWRRITPRPTLIVEGEDGKPRPSSGAFIDRETGEVSVHRAKLTTLEQVLTGHPGVGVAEINAGLPRSLGHALVPDPTEDDPSHALICPPPSAGTGRRKTDARRMATAATWVFPPPSVSEEAQP